MGLLGDYAADSHRGLRALLEGDSQTDSCGDCQSGFLADSHGDSKVGWQRELRWDLQGDFRRDYRGLSRSAE